MPRYVEYLVAMFDERLGEIAGDGNEADARRSQIAPGSLSPLRNMDDGGAKASNVRDRI
ncbi:hypothetical protein GCM10017620_31160 [Brevundimonas intermedia]|uniref:Uncharacterized protein n=1 Tax=Brevundimonas intermedia TaxID=74315 RepID=A0ABQ5TDH0_9CAUL|nr:hypothetical protein [Brevundimonas intermedia]GLK50142.1 hypothetical protein GCM10017620_31160 [Brevundimonas intermedia]